MHGRCCPSVTATPRSVASITRSGSTIQWKGSDMRVLFLAIGNVRRKTVLTAAREVLADGGAVTILVGSPKRWRTEDVPDEAEIVGITKLEREHMPLRLEHAALY